MNNKTAVVALIIVGGLIAILLFLLLQSSNEANKQAAYNECMRESHNGLSAVDYCKDCSERRDCRPPCPPGLSCGH